jgi:hypothetical protein
MCIGKKSTPVAKKRLLRLHITGRGVEFHSQSGWAYPPAFPD